MPLPFLTSCGTFTIPSRRTADGTVPARQVPVYSSNRDIAEGAEGETIRGVRLTLRSVDGQPYLWCGGLAEGILRV